MGGTLHCVAMQPDTAVVLAAGRGTRMRRDDIPKPLVPLGGRPMLDRVLDGLAASGLARTVLVIGHLGDMVRDHVGGTRKGMEISYARQESLDGTAAALTCAGQELDRDTPVLLTWCDIFVAPTWYRMLCDAWQVRKGLVLLATVIDGDLRMTDFVEKPPGRNRGWADGGVSVLSATARAVMAEVEPSERGERELASGIVRLLRDGRPIGVERYSGPWADLGTPEAVTRVEASFGELL
ncbi:MAG: nucleotidyltransferase family protein [Actinobacteria bacterium ATB1]|nr:nucleotidyltransferase family protein [Actinobacteria bacterium ATB1]